MLNVYYVPADYTGIPADAISLMTLAELKAFTPPDHSATLAISTAITSDHSEIVEHMCDYRRHIAMLAESPHTYDRWVRMRPGPVASQPFSSMIRLLADSIWYYQAGHWVELKASTRNPGPEVASVRA